MFLHMVSKVQVWRPAAMQDAFFHAVFQEIPEYIRVRSNSSRQIRSKQAHLGQAHQHNDDLACGLHITLDAHCPQYCHMLGSVHMVPAGILQLHANAKLETTVATQATMASCDTGLHNHSNRKSNVNGAMERQVKDGSTSRTQTTFLCSCRPILNPRQSKRHEFDDVQHMQVKAWLQGIDSSVATVKGHCQAAATSLPMCRVEAPTDLTAGG